jgi:hypothetical protein
MDMSESKTIPANYLDCPACGDPCTAIPPYRPTPQWPSGWWQDGDEGTCDCGAELVVDADGECAWLRERERE